MVKLHNYGECWLVIALRLQRAQAPKKNSLTNGVTSMNQLTTVMNLSGHPPSINHASTINHQPTSANHIYPSLTTINHQSAINQLSTINQPSISYQVTNYPLVNSHGNGETTIEIVAFPGFPLKKCDFPWFSLVFLWFSHGSPWFSMVFLWFPMVTRG